MNVYMATEYKQIAIITLLAQFDIKYCEKTTINHSEKIYLSI